MSNFFNLEKDESCSQCCSPEGQGCIAQPYLAVAASTITAAASSHATPPSY